MEKTKKLYIDCPQWQRVNINDFLVAIGVKQSNSVYHVAEVKAKPRPGRRIIRYYMEVYKSDLLTALKRDKEQKLITLYWYKR